MALPGSLSTLALELLEVTFGDRRIFRMDLLETITGFNSCFHLGSPSAQGGAHLCEGGFVYCVLTEIIVDVLRERVSCVQLGEEDFAQSTSFRKP